MKAREMVSIIYQYNSDWARETILANIDSIHEEMMGHRNLYTLYTDPVTGEDPVLTPTEVETVIDGAMDIEAVYTESDCVGPGYRGWHGTNYSEVPYCGDGVEHVYDNVIIFNENALNKEYRVRYYKTPTNILSENTELDVPDRYKRYLEDGVLARMEMQTNGSRDELRNWRRRDLREFWGKLNKQFRFKGNINEQRKIRTSY